MLPSMYSVDSDIYPPDVCCPRDIDTPTGWNQTIEAVPKARIEPNIVMDSNSSSDLTGQLEPIRNINLTVNDPDNIQCDQSLEGAVGGSLPDLCVTGSATVCHMMDDISESLNIKTESTDGLLNLYKHDEQVEYHSSDNTKSSEYSQTQLQLDSLQCEGTDEANDYLVHSCKHICLVACGTGDIDKDVIHIEKNNQFNALCPELDVCCDKFGALEKLSDLQTYGLDLVRQNLIQSSHSMYHKWECSAFIPSDFLSPMSLHSHGTPLGCDIGSAYILGFPFGRSHMSEAGPQLPEEEQIKIAKRFGLIQHLPCGIFNGSTKTRECVICMIDFSVGEKIRYLPCMHTYHTDCIDDWLMRSFTCPSCLEPVDAALLNTYETS